MSIPSSPIGAGANPSAAQFAAAGKPLASTSSTGIGKQNPAKARKAAREFEAQLIETWLQSLEQTYSIGAGKARLSGGDNYRYLGS